MMFWTAEEEERVAALRLRGLLVREIACEVGRSASSVFRKLHRLGVCGGRQSTAWPPEKTECAVAMWADGKSGSEIAAVLGATRGAVIGRMNRLGIPSPKPCPYANGGPRKTRREKLERRRAITRSRRAWNPVPVDKPPPQKQPLPVVYPSRPPLRLPILELGRRQCRYPVTDAPPHEFCGLPTLEGTSWCPEHHAVCLQPVPGRTIAPRPF